MFTQVELLKFWTNFNVEFAELLAAFYTSPLQATLQFSQLEKKPMLWSLFNHNGLHQERYGLKMWLRFNIEMCSFLWSFAAFLWKNQLLSLIWIGRIWFDWNYHTAPDHSKSLNKNLKKNLLTLKRLLLRLKNFFKI